MNLPIEVRAVRYSNQYPTSVEITVRDDGQPTVPSFKRRVRPQQAGAFGTRNHDPNAALRTQAQPASPGIRAAFVDENHADNAMIGALAASDDARGRWHRRGGRRWQSRSNPHRG